MYADIYIYIYIYREYSDKIDILKCFKIVVDLEKK